MLASSEEIKKRLKICEGCELLLKPTYNCKVCGCFMKVKTRLKRSKCPKNKW